MKQKSLTVVLAEIENSIYRLAVAIKKTQKRANALKNIIIPKYLRHRSDLSQTLLKKRNVRNSLSVRRLSRVPR